jgi:hypothetical protein
LEKVKKLLQLRPGVPHKLKIGLYRNGDINVAPQPDMDVQKNLACKAQ